MAASAPRTRNPGKTRENILDAAQALILDHGYSATSVDAVVARAGITKGAFFHHFASKADLAHELVERYRRMDEEHLESRLERARRLTSDPLQQLLVLIALYVEDFESMTEPFAGCLFASYVYEAKLFDEKVMDIVRESSLHWRRVMRGLLDRAAQRYPPRMEVDMDSLADLFYSITEGAFIMTKTLGDRTLLARQSQQLRNYLELLFKQ